MVEQMSNDNNHWVGDSLAFMGNELAVDADKIIATISKKNSLYHLCQATLDDLPAIVAIYNQSVGVANADFAPVSVASRQAWFLAHDDNRPIWVLKKTDIVVAWVSLSNLYDRPAYVHSTEISVYVDKAYAGLGLGRYLVQTMIGYAPRLDICAIVALIFAHNTPSLVLFTGLGFENWGCLPKVCLSQGAMADVVILGIKLDNR